ALGRSRHPGARLLPRDARADVLARGGAAELARAAQASAHDALADARRARRRAVARSRDARRRPAGPVDAARVPRARPLRHGPAGGDRRAEPPHGGVPELLLSARDDPAARRSGVARRRRHDRGAPRPRPRRRGVGRVVARPSEHGRAGPRRSAAGRREPARDAGIRGRPLMPEVWPGKPFPLGATWDGRGTNFSLFSENAERVELCLFDGDGHEQRIDVTEKTAHNFHCYVPGVGPGQLYGYRVHGAYDPNNGKRFNPFKLLLDPYAKAIEGPVQ